MKSNDWKEQFNMVYSTNPDFNYQEEQRDEPQTLPNEKQNLKIQLDKKNRSGKAVTLITNFIGTEEDLKTLAKVLKTKLSVGGSCKESQIIIQGDVRDKVGALLTQMGYKSKRVGG